MAEPLDQTRVRGVAQESSANGALCGRACRTSQQRLGAFVRPGDAEAAGACSARRLLLTTAESQGRYPSRSVRNVPISGASRYASNLPKGTFEASRTPGQMNLNRSTGLLGASGGVRHDRPLQGCEAGSGTRSVQQREGPACKRVLPLSSLVEPRGIEPLTSWLPAMRSPS